MDQNEIKKEFEIRRRSYAALEEEARFILEKALKKGKIKTHSVPSRVKDVASFIDKVRRKEFTNPFEQVQDIVGLRVVCLFLSDIPKVGQVIRENFAVLSEDDKIEGSEVNSFGYMSIHFVVQMKHEYRGPRYEGIAGMPFEIQVRTILMDAWANVSHYLAYKSDIDVPTNLKRDFHALSGLFYVADSHFELFSRSSSESRQQMVELASVSKLDLGAQEINLDSLSAYLHVRFTDRAHSEAKLVSELVQQLLTAGYKTIGEIAEVVDRTESAFKEYERDKRAREPKKGQKSNPYKDAGVVRVSLRIADEKFNALLGGLASVEKYRKMLPAEK
jgi:putative GTP pyrophosphokinase